MMSEFGPVPGALLLTLPGVLGDRPSNVVTAERTDPRGEFQLLVPAHASVVTLLVMAPGHAPTAALSSVDSDVELYLKRDGGELVLDLGQRTTEPLIVHEGAVLPVRMLEPWARRLGVMRPQESNLVLIPQVEPGSYSLCRNHDALTSLLAGREDANCQGGFVVPFGSLRLSIPQTSSDQTKHQ